MCLYLQERRRTEIVSKLEQVQELEKEAAVQERKELFEQRKAQKNKIIKLTNQVANVEMVGINTSSVLCVILYIIYIYVLQYEEWNSHDRLHIGFIRTKAKPPIFYLPVEQTHKTEELIKETQAVIEGTSSMLQNLQV